MKSVDKAGGKIIKKPVNTNWGGYGSYFSDLDGCVWEVAYGCGNLIIMTCLLLNN